VIVNWLVVGSGVLVRFSGLNAIHHEYVEMELSKVFVKAVAVLIAAITKGTSVRPRASRVVGKISLL